jgi:hypothetical protein
MGVSRFRQKKLAVRVGAGVGHGKDACTCESQVGMYLVLTTVE